VGTVVNSDKRFFSSPKRPDRPTQPPTQWLLGFFPRGKTAGVWS